MAAQRATTVDALLELETRQWSAANRANDDACPASPSRLNAVWRQKVIQWYFTLVTALRRQQLSTAEGGDDSPYYRTSVHVTATLLDTYLMSLPSERSLRYKHDRPAYQLLATTCLLLGMRLAQHDQMKESRQVSEANVTPEEKQGCGLKRAKTHRMNMDLASSAGSSPTAEVPALTSSGVAIPNAAMILRISAAPKSLSEQNILSMVREVTGSRSFPRAKVVTTLDFIRALGATSSHVGEVDTNTEEPSILLQPQEMEDAFRLADVSIRDVHFVGSRPSIVACAAMTLALARSSRLDLSIAALRQKVCDSIFGSDCTPELQVAVRKAESKFLSLQVGVPSSRNQARHVVVPTTHLIPCEDE